MQIVDVLTRHDEIHFDWTRSRVRDVHDFRRAFIEQRYGTDVNKKHLEIRVAADKSLGYLRRVFFHFYRRRF